MSEHVEKKASQAYRSNDREASGYLKSEYTAVAFPAVTAQYKAIGNVIAEADSEEKETKKGAVEEKTMEAPPILPPILPKPNADVASAVAAPIQAKSELAAIPVAPIQLQTSKVAVPSLTPPPFQFKSASIEEAMEEDAGIESKIKADPVSAPSNQLSNSTGLPLAVQAKMEGAMDADFSNVNIHKDSQSASEVGALAYAQGNEVHFAPGQYNPESSAGQELIGHELAHVVQQRQGRVQPTTQAKGLPVNDDKGLEAEADEMGRNAVQMKVETIQLFGNDRSTEGMHQDIYGDGNHHPSHALGSDSTAGAGTSTPTPGTQGAASPVVTPPPAPPPPPAPAPPPAAHAGSGHSGHGPRGTVTIGEPTLVSGPRGSGSGATPPPPTSSTTATPVPASTPDANPAATSARTPTAAAPTTSVDWGKFWDDNKYSILRTGLELGRLIPAYGLIAGLGADALETASDLETAAPAHDEFLNLLIGVRAPVVAVNNILGHLIYVEELTQDAATASVVAAEADLVLVPLGEALSSTRLGLLTVQTVIDASVLARSTMQMNRLPSTSPEYAAYRNTFAGYDSNLIMDGVELILTGLDMGSGGFANGSVMGRMARAAEAVFKNKNLFLRLGANFVKTVVGIWGGTGIGSLLPALPPAAGGATGTPAAPASAAPAATPAATPTQRKMDMIQGVLQKSPNSGADLEGVSRNLAADVLLMELSALQNSYHIGSTIVNMAADQADRMMGQVNGVSQAITGQDAVPALRDGINRGLTYLDQQLQGVLETQPFITSAREKSLEITGFLNTAQASIDSIQIPRMPQSQSDYIPDAVEALAAQGLNAMISRLQNMINQVKAEAHEKIDSLKTKADEIAEFLQTLIGILQQQIEFIRGKIAELTEALSRINSLEDINNLILGEISSILGIDPPLTAAAIREGWAEFNGEIEHAFELGRNAINTHVRGT